MLDEFRRARIRRLLGGFFGHPAALDSHLALLDARGAWYAEAAVGAWDPDQPDAFFGLIRHVVRTQLGGPAPDPDLESWLAAGRPEGALGPIWDQLNTARYPVGRRVAGTARPASTAPAVSRLDDILLDWPPEHLPAFTNAYAEFERVLEEHAILLPPIGQ